MRHPRKANNYDPPEHTYIYTLSDPNTGKIKYVGKSDNPETRLRQHIANCNRTYASYGLSPKKKWIRGLKRQGQEPVLKIVERCKQEVYKERENYWIAQLMGNGAPLVNGNSTSTRLTVNFDDAVWGKLMAATNGNEQEAAEKVAAIVADFYGNG